MSDAFREVFSGEGAAYWLDWCLEHMAQGWSPEEALQRVPKRYRAEVASLLLMAQTLQQAPHVIPRKSFAIRRGHACMSRSSVTASLKKPRLGFSASFESQ